METSSTQKIPFHSRLLDSAAWAVNGVVDGIGSAATKTYDAWVNTPKAFKLPFETIAILNTPGEWRGPKGALAAATALIETPRSLAAFLSNQPVQYFGERWQLYSFPMDSKAPLTDLDKKIGAFERSQPPFFNPPFPLKIVDESLTTPIDSPSTPTQDRAKITDKNLEILIEKVSYFSVLKAMHSYSGVPESDAAPLLCLVDEASRGKNPSLWKIFTDRYGAKMGLWGRVKAGFIYLFLWNWIPIIPKTVDAYMKNMLTELRVNLKENGEKRKKFINGLLEDADNFFEVYNGAAETYANDNARKGNLNHYRKNAIDLILPREDLTGKTPEQSRMELYRKLSASIVDHFSPGVRFGFLDGWLNSRIQNALRDEILPEVFLNISDEGQEATKRHNIPFFLALTKTLTAQISKIQGKMEDEPSDTSSFYGIKNFEAIVKKVLWTIDMADCKTPEEIRMRMEKLKQPWKGIDGEVRNGIQLGIQKGLAVLFDYLSKQENTEELFANLFESITFPLSGHLPMNDKQWAEMAVEYEGAKILLKQAGSALSKQIVQSSIQDKVGGGKITEVTQIAAKEIFAGHKARGQETFEELLRICDAAREKLHHSKDFDSEMNIYTELASIASVLKAFENKERVKITVEQDPPPKIATLPHSEQESILRILHPLYEGSNQIMDHVLNLQNLQKQYPGRTALSRVISQIKKAIEEVGSSPSSPRSLELIEQIAEHFKTIEALELMEATKLKDLKNQVDSIGHTLTQIANGQRSLDALANLQPFIGSTQPDENKGLIDQLVLAVQSNPLAGFKKWRCIEQIKENVKLAGFSPFDEKRIADLLEKMSQFNSLPKPRPNFNRDIWEPLVVLVNIRKTALEGSQKRAAALLEQNISHARDTSNLEETRANRLSQNLLREMQEKGDLLLADAWKFYKLIESAKKETLPHPTAAELGQVGGTLGFALGLALAALGSPETGSALGAAFATGIYNLSSFAKGRWLKFSTLVGGAGTASYFATQYLSDKARNTFVNSSIPHLIGAFGASAGFEYVGAKINKRLVDTGVEVVIPKVTEIFDSAYEHLLTNDIVINGGLKIMMKQMVDLFPPKK